MHMPPVFHSSRTTILDCGASRTALGVFRRQGSRLRLDDHAVESFSATAGHGDDWLENTRQALTALRSRVKVAGPAVLVLPPHLTLAKMIKTPRVDAAQWEKIIRFEAEQNLPYALADVVWASVHVGGCGDELEHMLVAAKLAAVDQVCAAAQSAGFEPRLVLPAPLATLAAFRLAQPAPAETALVLNLGARSTILLLAGPDHIAGRTLALGSRSITQQMAVPQACDPAAAEAVKQSEHSAGLTADARDVFATRLAQEISRSMLHFSRRGDVATPGRVHLTGGGSRLAGLDVALAARLKVPVDRLDFSGAVEIAGGAEPSDMATLADLAGAAATQLRPGLQVINLLPPRLRRHENQLRRKPWLIGAALLAVAALLPPAVHYHRLEAAARERIADIEAEIVPWRQREVRNNANLAQLEQLRWQVDRLQEVQARRTRWLALLADLQERLVRAEDVWLESLSVHPAGSGAPWRLHLSGRMLDTTNPLARGSVDNTTRVKTLLNDLDRSPQVRVVEEGLRFDQQQPGILKFDFVLVANRAGPF